MIIDWFLVEGLRKPEPQRVPLFTPPPNPVILGAEELNAMVKQFCEGLGKAFKRPRVQSDFALLNGPGKGSPDV